MNILHLAFHTSPFSIVGKNDGGGMSVYVQQISKYLSENHNVTVVTGEKQIASLIKILNLFH